MSKKEKAPQIILSVPAGLKVPSGLPGYEVSAKSSGSQSSGKTRPELGAVEPEVSTIISEFADATDSSAAPVPLSADPADSLPQSATEPKPSPTRGSQSKVKVTESYLSAKLRQSEQGGRAKKIPARYYDQPMADMWQEMEDKISFKAPRGTQLPADFLRSMGLDGQEIMISPRAIEALKAMLGGKKNG